MAATVINTIGDVRKFLEQFGPESDDLPFVIWDSPNEEAIDLVTASSETNEPGYPPYAMLVCSDLVREIEFAKFFEDSANPASSAWLETLMNEAGLRAAVRKAAT